MDCATSRDFEEQIISTVKKGDYEAADEVMDKYSFLFSAGPKFMMLHHFAESGYEKVVQYLLARGHDINAEDPYGRTPIMFAAMNYHRVIVKLLLAAGADILILGFKKVIVSELFDEQLFCLELGELYFKVLCNKFSTYEELTQSLISARCQLYQACCFRNVKIIQHMLEHGFPVDSMHLPSKQSALHVAVAKEDTDTVQLLLNCGANDSAKDVQGATPLSFVYRLDSKHTREKIEILKVLLNLQTSVTSCNFLGFFQITPTLTNGNHEAIRVVLLSNIDFTAKDQAKERSILHWLAANGNPGVVEELKPYASRYDVNAVDKLGMSPLHVAVAHKNVEMVEFLLEQGATPDGNKYHPTPLYCAYEKFEPNFENQLNQSVELLLRHNADPQLAFSEENNKQVTVFDAAKKTNSVNNLLPVIAHLVILEMLGVPMNEITITEIHSYPLLKKYFNRCRELIRKDISGPITLFKLLTGKEKQIARYAGNRELMLKLTRLSCKNNLRSSYSYYHNILEKNFSKGIRRSRLVREITGMICKISKNKIHEAHHFIIDKITDFLDNESILQLCKLSEELNM